MVLAEQRTGRPPQGPLTSSNQRRRQVLMRGRAGRGGTKELPTDYKSVSTIITAPYALLGPLSQGQPPTGRRSHPGYQHEERNYTGEVRGS